MRAGFEIVSGNQPSYRRRITRIEVSAHAERIAVLWRTEAALQCRSTNAHRLQNRSQTAR